MTPEQIDAVRSSWQRLSPRADAMAERFYRDLFAIDRDAARLFDDVDMAKQQTKFMAMLDQIVRLLDTPQALLVIAAPLSRRHLTYGVRERHFASVGESLIGALAHAAGDDFTPELRAAWQEAYALVGAIMQRAQLRTATSPHRQGSTP
jgi:hemoglobin-like flavoprotein